MATDNDTELEQDVTPVNPEEGTADPAPQDLLKEEPVVPEGDKTPAPEWPEDWREQMSGGNEQVSRLLSRYRNPANVGKALHEARTRMSQQSTPAMPSLSDNPTEQEISEYRQAFGIPEEAGGYDVELPDYLEEDKELMDLFLEHAHDRNMSPNAVQSAVDWYSEYQMAVEQDRNEYGQTHRNETEDYLRQEWGSEFRGNLNAVTQYINNVLGEEVANELRTFRNEHGATLGNDARFLQLLVQPAIDSMGANSVYAGDDTSVAQSLNERKDELLQLQLTDPEKYKSDTVQSELNKIYERISRIGSSGSQAQG